MTGTHATARDGVRPDPPGASRPLPRVLRISLALALVAHALPAFAYIDPGTGSALFYVVTGLVVSVYFALRGAYYRAIELLFSLRRRDQACGIAVHSEDPRYETTFLPVLRRLAGRGVEVTYFTMYPRGDAFEPLPAGIAHREIAPGLVGYAHLNHIEAVVMATTTPQLDVMTFRRSRRVRHYAMVQHALGECRYVRPFAYDYYDSVLCCGPVLRENIRRMEALRGLPPKELREAGVPHYEVLLENAQATSDGTGRPVVLVAPSWGPLGMFAALGTQFIQALAQRYHVIVRPHPQMGISQPDLHAQVLALADVEIDTALVPSAAMARADLLLSDISGIVYEFAFIHRRPVIVVDRRMELGGLEGELLGGDSELRQACADFIVSIDPAAIGDVASLVERTLSSVTPGRIADVRDALVYRFADGGAAVAAHLLEIHQREAGRAVASAASGPGIGGERPA
ncbi:CDP-glycerol glycerophosphotransferase family protein [Xanthomonas sp. XNM01]|uniref:CDP-glycerol glycerophosphotransferase family protein n=1 Tax=Xanthomonas sp. XNM01 TaxID=2769289 RepID=UPI00177C2386|nr:CDP-glycerol glycerophosphotransferase family protein [Xanthomonas sp. XNM01]MBD9369456.1 CDP-glycerol glycerophosphotransferase family protein [Xanthomonas sp. XNM01]